MTENFRPGTEIDNNPTGETNPTYNDLLAIWDGYNGTGMDNLTNGTPSGWLANYYWSATPSSIGHTYLNLGNGFVSGNVDAASAVWVALQVRFPDTTAPTANFGSATDNVGTVTGTLSSGNTTDDTSLALAGTCESGSTVNVYNGAALLGAATVTGTGWSYSATVVDAPPTSSM